MSPGLVLSLFPGIGLLDMAFEEEGFCVVRGPDLLWGGDVRTFHPPAGKFDGVIGGPPCQAHSRLSGSWNHSKQPDMVPDFARCIQEAGPRWFLMENVQFAPDPKCPAYHVTSIKLNNRECPVDGSEVGAVQSRLRRFWFGIRRDISLDGPLFLNISRAEQENPVWTPAVLASGWVKPGTETQHRTGRIREYGWSSWAQLRKALPAQGLPENFLDQTPFTLKGAFKMIGNGVPLPMGRAIARAVRLALNDAERMPPK